MVDNFRVPIPGTVLSPRALPKSAEVAPRNRPTLSKTNTFAGILSTIINGKPSLSPEVTTQSAMRRASIDASSPRKSALRGGSAGDNGASGAGEVDSFESAGLTVERRGASCAAATIGHASTAAARTSPILRTAFTVFNLHHFAHGLTQALIAILLGWIHGRYISLSHDDRRWRGGHSDASGEHGEPRSPDHWRDSQNRRHLNRGRC